MTTYQSLKRHMGHQLYVEVRTGTGEAVVVCSTCKEDVLSVRGGQEDTPEDQLAYAVFSGEGELRSFGTFTGADRHRVEIYDVEWDSGGQGYYSNVGCGPWEGSYVATFHGERPDLHIYQYAPYCQATLSDLVGQYGLIEADVVWCDICRNWFVFESACEHLFWDDEIGWWSGPGYVG